ncbi:hypothetical protein MARPO_0168s0003 [Marchantia polymorpha]|uniref:Uncharacterized protein n=1 Tax=Marchantia polymorpha TaxID=3197 RepID=A0A2R6W361_MARPO|nr:hypothetical protein MARPO_0168s0003 [Marchantia polymorpha]|eukprot:PTQ28276.1 hypothetical protein MARPO_0168s0003 [Marchantia polymorpha]
MLDWKKFGIPDVIRSFPNEKYPQMWTFFGSILCRLWRVGMTLYRVQLANLITGRSFNTRTLPSPVIHDGMRKPPCAVHLMQGDEICDFKILLLYERDLLKPTKRRAKAPEDLEIQLRLTVQIYASDTRSWNVVTHDMKCGPALIPVHYSNSVCYGDDLYAVLATSSRSHMLQFVFNVSTEHWTTVSTSPRCSENWRLKDMLVTSSSEREIGNTFIYQRDPFTPASLRRLHSISTVKLDKSTLQVSSRVVVSNSARFAKDPVATKIEKHETGAYGDQHSSMYVVEGSAFGDSTDEPYATWYFDIAEDAWHEFTDIPYDVIHYHEAKHLSKGPLPCIASSFAPGLNPFAEWRDV